MARRLGLSAAAGAPGVAAPRELGPREGRRGEDDGPRRRRRSRRRPRAGRCRGRGGRGAGAVRLHGAAEGVRVHVRRAELLPPVQLRRRDRLPVGVRASDVRLRFDADRDVRALPARGRVRRRVRAAGVRDRLPGLRSAAMRAVHDRVQTCCMRHPLQGARARGARRPLSCSGADVRGVVRSAGVRGRRVLPAGLSDRLR